MENNCVLNLERLFFQNIEFSRLGEKNAKELHYEVSTEIMQKSDEEVYKVALSLKGNKEDEYQFLIELVGIFSVDVSSEMDKEFKKEILTKNTVAIMMPYIRSEVSILTAQPGIDCVVLPPFNINAMMDE